jgi:hypothetical protein
VIVIFASSYDHGASALAAQWSDFDASLLTCSDLSLTGWRHFLNSPAESTAVIGTRVVPVNEITGALIRWPGVFVEELTQIVPEDRNYVAVEMTAFLVSWFKALRCPVVNSPTPLNLTGPAWCLEQWTHVAANLGIPVRAARRQISRDPAPTPANNGDLKPATVTVVGNHCWGDVDETLSQQARALASAAGVLLLEVTFSGSDKGSFFTGANLVPEISGEIRDSVLELLREGR